MLSYSYTSGFKAASLINLDCYHTKKKIKTYELQEHARIKVQPERAKKQYKWIRACEWCSYDGAPR